MPQSSEYLIKELGSSVLNGYNIVGDGTPAALIPILTGKHEEELPNTLKGVAGSKKVDQAYPFVWNDFADKLNFASLYNEDWPGASKGTGVKHRVVKSVNQSVPQQQKFNQPRGVKKENLWYRALWSGGQKRKKGTKKNFLCAFNDQFKQIFFVGGG